MKRRHRAAAFLAAILTMLIIAYLATPMAAVNLQEPDKPETVTPAEINKTVRLAASTPPVEPDKPTPEPEPTPGPITADDWYGVAPEDLPDRLKGLYIPSAAEIDRMSIAGLGESGSVKSTTERAGVYWCMLGWVDEGSENGFEDTITEVVVPDYFHGYQPWRYPVKQKFKDLAIDVITRWLNEKLGYENVGRVLPHEFHWFQGNKNATHNIFRNKYHSWDENCVKWDWSLPSPYDS